MFMMKIVWVCFVLAFMLHLEVSLGEETTSAQGTTGSQQCDGGECKMVLGEHTGPSNMEPSIEKSDITLLLLGFGGFALVIAVFYRTLRKYVFKDIHNLDTVFDAGGQVSLSLTAATVTSQLLWPADFIQTTTLSIKFGIGTALWISVGIVIDMQLFPALSLYLKTRAPGAKTFPQIAYARFGKMAHINFCIIALATNVMVCCSILLAGKMLIEAYSKDSNNEFIFIISAFLFGSYCLVGGLGTTFYISYFNTALTFLSVSVFILLTSFYPSEEIREFSTPEAMYDAIIRLQGPEGNYEHSYLTFRTESGLIFGLVVLFLATSVIFCDQANWQSRIAAKPAQGVIGFLFSAYLWFLIPMTISTAAPLVYLAMSAKNGTHLLSEEEIDIGYGTPFVMTELLGDTGAYLLLIILNMALMSTGSGEVMAISSIVIYDIYKTYINPFRKNLTPTACVLCGKEKFSSSKEDNIEQIICRCPTSIGCVGCKEDIKAQSKEKHFAVHYKCKYHGRYRHYEDGLLRYKSWCIVWIVVGIVPFGLLLSETDMNVYWATLAIPVFTSPFLLPLFFTFTWSKATGPGIISGGIFGLIASISAMLITASTYEGGLDNFYVNTSEDKCVLFSVVAGVVVSGLLCVGVSLCTHKIQTDEDASREWEKTINIDNPLNPFRLIYKQELEEIGAGPIITSDTMDRIFVKAKRVAYIGGGFSIVLFLLIIPAVVLSYPVLTQAQFTAWLRFFQWCCFVGTVIVVVVPPIEEGLLIWRKYKERTNHSTSIEMDKENQVEMAHVYNVKL